MISPQSIRQGEAGGCDQNGLGIAEKWTSVSPCLHGARRAAAARRRRCRRRRQRLHIIRVHQRQHRRHGTRTLRAVTAVVSEALAVAAQVEFESNI